MLLDRIVAGLTEPGNTSAGNGAPGARNASEIVCRGTFDEVNAYFARMEWTDGLPIVPPTVERVEQFLKHVNQSPHETIAILRSANLLATPWNIAVNAIMAGCRPEHMPLLVAAVRALGEDRCSLENLGSTSTLVPYVLVNGPIVEELGIAHGAHLISMGPNPAIGRAVGLIVRNIAGFRPGKTYMGTYGYPLVFALAERDEDSPWPSFHVEAGFARSASTVTIGVTNNWGPLPTPVSKAGKSAAQATLELISREIVKKDRLCELPGRGPHAPSVTLTILVSPPVARALAEAGYSKDGVRQYLYENTRMPLREFEWFFNYTTPGSGELRDKVESGVYPPEFLGDPEDVVRILSSPDLMHIIVCGDPNRNRIMVLVGGHTRPTTKEIEMTHVSESAVR